MEEIEKSASLAKEFTLIYGLELLQAVIILLIGYWLAGVLSRAAIRGFARVNLDETLESVIAGAIRWVILVITIVAVLARFGVETTSIIAILGAAGLAVGLALQGTLQNISAGIMLLLLRPFKLNDFIVAGDISGTVEEIGMFTTHLKMVDGLYLEAPNSSLWGTAIINYSRNPTRRISLDMGISYDDDIGTAMEILIKIMADDERTLDDPEPTVVVTALADSSVTLTMHCWVERSDYWNTLVDMIRAGKENLEAGGCSIPYPQQDVHMHSVND
jgi:small conductance mechanosensitive channel